MLELWVESLLANWRTPPAGRALEQRRFPVHDGGCLVFRVPPEWREEIALGGPLSSVIFRPAGRRGRLLSIAMRPLTVPELLAFSIEGMRREVEQAARQSAHLGGAADPFLEPFAGRFGGGFHFSMVRKGRGRARRMTRGSYLVRPVVLDFRIDTATTEAALRAEALELVRSARASSS